MNIDSGTMQENEPTTGNNTHGYDTMEHVPVLLHEVIDALQIHPEKVYIDGTLGAAGHATSIAKKLAEKGFFLGFDRDEASIQYAQKKFSQEKISAKYAFHHGSFEEINAALQQHRIGSIDGVIIDLGWNMDQFQDARRGFSFSGDGLLDMRYGTGDSLTAHAIVNYLDEKKLADLIYGYSDERFSRQIARGVMQARREGEIQTTSQLAHIVSESIPRRFQKKNIHPATKTFQALRIAVNDEYGHIERALPDIIEKLAPEGRLLVITFHSGEDRIVKNIFKKIVTENPDEYQLIGKKGITASTEELERNPRARSARLRIIERK